MQLPREIVVETPGEIREAYSMDGVKCQGNPEPSPAIFGREGAETRAKARTQVDILGKRPAPSSGLFGTGDEIVQAWKKFQGPCNH